MTGQTGKDRSGDPAQRRLDPPHRVLTCGKPRPDSGPGRSSSSRSRFDILIEAYSALMTKEQPIADNADSMEVTHAAQLARVGGPVAISLEVVARRAHVEIEDLRNQDRQALVRKVSSLTMSYLADEIAEQVGDAVDGETILQRVGRGYVSFAVAEPGWFEAALFTQPFMANVHVDEARGRGRHTPMEYLEYAFEKLVAEQRVAPECVGEKILVCWSGVHGFATLVTRGPLRSADPAQVRSQTATVVDQIVRGVLVT